MGKLDNFKVVTRIRVANRVLQTLMAVALLLQINWMSIHFFSRTPLTHTAGHSLSPETLAYLRKVQVPLKAIVTFSPNPDEPSSEEVFAYIQSLLKEYDYAMRASGEDMFQIEYVDLYKQRKRAEELANKYGLRRTNSVLLVGDDKHYQISDTDFYHTKNGQIAGFKGEQVLTRAILSVTAESAPKIYFLSGHGEMQLESVNPIRGLSQAAGFLKSKGLELDSLDLNLVSKVPDDADMVIIASPQVALLPSEVEKIRQYLEEGRGTVTILMDPIKPHGLTNLLLDWGIIADDAVLYDEGKGHKNSDGDIIVRRFAEHPINNSLIDYRVTVLAGLSRPVRVDLGRPFNEKRRVLPLMASSSQSWGERNYADLKNPVYDEDKDIPGPLSLAVLSEDTIASHLGINLPGGRMLVLGSGDVFANHRLGLLGNEMLLSGIINWALEGDNFLRVEPVRFQHYQIAISQEEFFRFLRYCLVLPCAIGIVGLIVFLRRRH